MRSLMRRETFALALEAPPSTQHCYEVAVLIVGYRNADDVSACLAALNLAAPAPNFDVFICENGGAEAFEQLSGRLLESKGPCDRLPAGAEVSLTARSEKFLEVKAFTLKSRFSRVFLGHAARNLGYAGAINAWLTRLRPLPGWAGV